MPKHVTITSLETDLPSRLADANMKAANATATALALDATINGTGQPITFEQFPVAASGLTNFNAAAIAQDTITTAPNGNIYAVYWDAERNPRIAAKSPKLEGWATAAIGMLEGNPLAAPVLVDSHNNIVVAVDGDGYIHVSGNHHNHRLRYARSRNPYDITAWDTPGMIGTDEKRVCYPQFVRTTGGDLLFFYREGESGNGDHLLNRYSVTSKTWSRVSMIFKGTTPVVPDQSAYINRVVLDKNNRLHVFYMWRETPDAATNTDLSYIYSDDFGVTWKNKAGATQALPITPSNTAPRILAGNPGGLINQSGASVDSNGVPHTLFWLNGPTVKQLHHFYWNGAAWADVVVADAGTGISRATAYSTTDGKTYAVYLNNRKPVAKRIYPTLGNEVTLYPHEQGAWEPAYDAHVGANLLRLMLSPANTSDPTYSRSYAGALTVDMTKVESLPSTLVLPAPRSVPAPETEPVVDGLPLLPGRFYIAAGETSQADTFIPAGEFRGAVVTSARTAHITTFGVDVLFGATRVGTTRILVFDLGGKLLHISNPIDTTALGVRTTAASFLFSKGQSVVVGTLTQGDSSPGLRWLEGTRDHRVGGASASSALAAVKASGFSATGIVGDVPTQVTLNGTSRVPLVALGVWNEVA